MKIVLIGSTQYKDTKFVEVKERLESEGHEVRVPAFNAIPDKRGLTTCKHNRELIRWCDEVHLIYDGKSRGALFDFGMIFYAEKPLVIEYMEAKSFIWVMEDYAEETQQTKE